MKFKFKRMLKWSLSATIVTTAALVSSYSLNSCQENFRNVKDKRPDLVVHYDTMYATKEYFDTHKKLGLGQFNPVTNDISVKHWVPADDSTYTKHMTDLYNGEQTAVFRHESEHARKALLWLNVQEHSPLVRGEIAGMNETMACASEVIESAENEWRTKKPTVARASLRKAARAVLEANSKLPANSFEVDFNDPKIADIVLKYAIDKYIDMFNRGAYKKHVRKWVNPRAKWKKYTPHNQCNIIDRMMFRPEKGDWSQMFTFETKNGKKVDIWKSASQKMRDEVQTRVDSAAHSQIRPGEMLLNLKNDKR